METGDLLETIAGLASQLKQYAGKLPPVVPLNVVPGGMKPTPEAVEAFEKTVYRFRDLGGASAFKRFTDLFIESLEAFEAGRVLAAIQPLLLVLDRLEVMQREKTITFSPKDEARLKAYRTTLHKILPGSQPELEGAGRGL